MKLVEKILIAIFVVTLCGPAVWGWRSFKVIFTSFPYEFNSDFGEGKIKIQNNSAGDSTVDVAFNLNEDIEDISLVVVIAIESDTGNFTALLNRTLDFCKFLKQRSAEPLLRLIYEDMLKYGNFIKSCPIKKGPYTLNGYRMDEEILPSYIPEANFFAEIKLDTPTKKLFKGTLHGQIDKSKGFNNLKMFSLG